MTKHTLIALMEDKPGVLNRVASLFRRRNFNIESLTVGHSETPGISRMTIVVNADHAGGIEQVEKQLYKLVNVTKVSDVSHEPTVIRELALIKVHAAAPTRAEIMQLVDIFRANVVDVAHWPGGQSRLPGAASASLRYQRDGAHGPRGDGARRQWTNGSVSESFEFCDGQWSKGERNWWIVERRGS
jgi:acetolactate synthase small subunit